LIREKEKDIYTQRKERERERERERESSGQGFRKQTDRCLEFLIMPCYGVYS